MVFEQGDDSHSVLDEIYYQFLVRSDYGAAFSQLSDIFGAHSACILSVKDEHPFIRAVTNVNPASMEAHASELGAQDPLNRIRFYQPPTVPLALSRCTDIREIWNSEYQEQVHDPSDIGDILGLRLHTREEHVVISLYRDKSRLFASEDVSIAKRISPHVTRCLRLLQRKWALNEDVYRKYGLTLKEAEILERIQSGQSYVDIMEAARITRNTLKWHMKNIFSKFSVNSLAALLLKVRA